MTLVQPTSSTLPEPGIVTIRRSTTRLLRNILRNPLRAFPALCYSERMVLARNLGVLRAYICDPALVHEALVRNAERLDKDDATKEVLGRSLGKGLLTADGPAWRWQRHTLAPAFQHDRLKALLPAMIAAAETTRDRWMAEPSGTVEVRREMMHTTFAIIVETMLSGSQAYDVDRMEANLSRSLGASSWAFAMSILKAPRWVPFPGKRSATKATLDMRETVRASIAARRAAEQGGADLIAMLLAAAEPETGRTMSDEEITDNIMTFILAGHETTAVALTWAFSLLSDHPAIADRIAAEVEAVTGGEAVAPDHIAELAYTKQVVNEVMRLYPPAPMVARRVARAVEIGGVSLPDNAVIFVPVYAIHHHTAFWDRPDIFDPDRFAPEAAKARHRFAFMPFGAGPRICIGSAFAMMEAVAILAVLVRAMRLERLAAVPPEPMMRVTLRPREALEMRVARRA